MEGHESLEGYQKSADDGQPRVGSEQLLDFRVFGQDKLSSSSMWLFVVAPVVVVDPGTGLSCWRAAGSVWASA